MRTRFGPFTLDPETRQLIRGDADVHLSPKAFDLLCTLVDSRPRVVEKADLHARIWPDTHVVDANLNILIGEIRRALGDSVQRPEFIRTVHGVGYAFCGTAAEVSAPRDAMFCWLAWQNRTFPLADGDNVVGRDPRCVVWLDADGVSRRHANIHIDAARRRVTLEDLGSTNGTFVRHTPVTGECQLADGDPIEIGSVALTIHLWASETAPETRRIHRKTPSGDA